MSSYSVIQEYFDHTVVDVSLLVIEFKINRTRAISVFHSYFFNWLLIFELIDMFIICLDKLVKCALLV